MKTFNNLITAEQIAKLKEFWTTNAPRVYVNWEAGEDVIDHRLPVLPSDPEWAMIEAIVRAEHPTATDIWSALQKQSRAHNIHIDDFSKRTPHQTYTYVIALDTIPEFKTIVWQEEAHDNDTMIEKYFMSWDPDNAAPVSNISTTEDLEHTLDPNRNLYLADYLNLDGIFTYQAGSAVLFKATQLHCTSNWNKYPQYKMRELLQIHYAVPN